MAAKSPYQALLLRLLHGAIAVLLITAFKTGGGIFDAYGQKIENLLLPLEARQLLATPILWHQIAGCSASIGLFLFALYNFQFGRNRLVQKHSLQALKTVGQPIWWYTLHRLVNTWLLIGLTLVVVAGCLFSHSISHGQAIGELGMLHGIAFRIIMPSVVLHLLMSLRVGGVPLLLSMFNFKHRESDQSFSWQLIRTIVTTLPSQLRNQRDNVALLLVQIWVLLGSTIAWLAIIF
jgi:hypothetical protein